MKYLVVTSDEAKKVLKKWKKSNPILLKKFQQIYYELAEHPREGTGHPEPLKERKESPILGASRQKIGSFMTFTKKRSW